MSNQEPNVLADELDRVARTGLNRRRFLIGAGVTGMAVAISACGGDDEKSSSSTTSSSKTTAAGGGSTTAAGGGKPSGDAAIAMTAAGLEVLAVGTYKAALDAATAKKLGAVPPAVAEYVTTAMGQHQEQLDAWNKVLTDAGAEEVTEPNATLKPVVDAEFAKVKDVAGAAKLALMLEEIAADTYLAALPVLESPEAIKLAGSIQIVDQQHRSILLYALGEYPVPEVFQNTDKAAK